MGNLTAIDLADNVDTTGLRNAVIVNLRSNHYPPIPVEYTDPVIRAIEWHTDSEGSTPIDITDACTIATPRLAWEDESDEPGVEGTRVWIESRDLLTITHSWDFVSPWEGEW